MVTSVSSLKNILQPSPQGKERFASFVKAMRHAIHIGAEADELPQLQEATQLAIQNGSTDEQAKTIYLSARYYLRKGSYAQATTLFH